MKRLLVSISVILICAFSYCQSAFEYFSIGIVKYNLNDYAGAISDFDKALEANPEYSEAYNLRGASKYNLGDFEGAIEDYSMAIELDSRNTGGVRLTIYDRTGKMIGSNTPARVDPGLAAPYFNRALARDAIEELNGAIEDYSAAIDIDPNLITVYYFRGQIKHRLGNRDGACADWKLASESGVTEAAELIRKHCQTEPD